MKTVLLALLVAAVAYVAGVFLGIGLVDVWSAPKPDRSVESVMTGFFFVGPALAVVGFIGGLIYFRRRHSPS